MSVKRSLPVAALVMVLLAAWAPASLGQIIDTGSRVFDCSEIPPDVARIGPGWKQPAQDIKVLAAAGDNQPIPLATKLHFDLLPMEQITIVWKPKNPRWMKNNGGLLSFRTGKAGRYWFVLDRYVWLEILPVDGSSPALQSAKSHAAIDACYGTGKNVAFDLAADTHYWLQMSGTEKVPTDLLIMPPQ